MKYTIYHLVANQGGRYTKHIYIGGERIVSKIGDFASYGPDPRRIEYAGSEADAVTVDYDVKYSQQLQAIKDNYATFGVPYNGTDNDDYVNGEGFCCDDGSLEAAQAKTVAQANALDGNFQEGDAYENLQFYYHADHLGSASYITNLDGEVVQHVEYVPFGEVFIEERNNTWNTPYLFNAKEFDEETGLYYYGARYYDPRLSVWVSTDPAENDYPSISSYSYTFNNPVNAIDPNGEKTIFVNGHWSRFAQVKIKIPFLGSIQWNFGPKEGGRNYWNRGFTEAALSFFNESGKRNSLYVDGSSLIGFDQSGEDRFKLGQKYAKNNFENIVSDLGEHESIHFVTHSEGSAFGAGMADYLISRGVPVDIIIHLSADEGDEFSTPLDPLTIQFSYDHDFITKNHLIKGTDIQIIKDRFKSPRDRLLYAHGSTNNKDVFSELKQSLKKIDMNNLPKNKIIKIK